VTVSIGSHTPFAVIASEAKQSPAAKSEIASAAGGRLAMTRNFGPQSCPDAARAVNVPQRLRRFVLAAGFLAFVLPFVPGLPALAVTGFATAAFAAATIASASSTRFAQ
jgi:hypothetical protein